MCLAIPGRIVAIRGEDPLGRTGTVDFGGVSKEIDLSFVPEAAPGDYVLVHAGFALNTVDEAEARKVFDYLREIEEAVSGEGDEAEPSGSEEPASGDTDETHGPAGSAA